MQNESHRATDSPASSRIDSIRSLHFIPSLEVGGLERMATDLVVGLVPLTERVVVCSGGGDRFAEPIRQAGVRLVQVSNPVKRPAVLPSTALALARVMHRERPDIVHAHNPTAAVAVALARRLVASRWPAAVTTYHGGDPSKLRRAVRALSWSSDLVVGVGPTVTGELLEAGLPPEKSATIANGVSVHCARTPAAVRQEFGVEGAELIVAVGVFREEKNHLLLLEAIARLAPRRPRLRALIVGGGPLERELRERTSELHLEGVASIVGERNDAIDIINAADVFVLSSLWEALPLVLLEAMMLGRAVVATDVSGISDVVKHDQTGLLVPSSDVGRLAGAVDLLLADNALRSRLGVNGQASVKGRYSSETMVSRYLDLYMQVIAKRSRGRSAHSHLIQTP